MYRLKVVISEEEQNKILPKPYFGKVIYKKTNNSNNNKNLLMDPNEKIGEIERKSTPEEENKEIEKITIDNIDNLGDHNTLRLSGSCGDKELKIPESNIISFSSAEMFSDSIVSSTISLNPKSSLVPICVFDQHTNKADPINFLNNWLSRLEFLLAIQLHGKSHQQPWQSPHLY